MNFTSLDNLERFLNKLSFATKESGVLNSIINSYLNDFKDDLVRIVQELPQSGEDGILYLVPQGNDRFIEYYYTNNEWIQLGSSVFDYTVDSTLSNNSTNTIQNSTIKNALDLKLNANQVVNALNNSSNETPQSGVIYNSLGVKLDSSDFLNIQNSDINDLFKNLKYVDVEIYIPYDSYANTTRGSTLGTYADEGDDTEYTHYKTTYLTPVLKGLQFSGLTLNSFTDIAGSNSSPSINNVSFKDSDENIYNAVVTIPKQWESYQIYDSSRALEGTGGASQSFAMESLRSDDPMDFKIHFTDKINIENLILSFYSNAYYSQYNDQAWARCNVKIKISDDGVNYIVHKDIKNLWANDEVKYNAHLLPNSNFYFNKEKFKFTVEF